MGGLWDGSAKTPPSQGLESALLRKKKEAETMRTILITVQAGIITLLAVIGAHSGSKAPAACPAQDIVAEQHCSL